MSKTFPLRRDRRWLRRITSAAVFAALLLISNQLRINTSAHGFGSPITWNREVSRIVYTRCASCHRPGGAAFSLMRYSDAQPRANEIKAAVLARRMPPWGAIKGFGHFRNDESLTSEQIELITKWVDGGIRRGNNPRLLPKEPVFDPIAAPHLSKNALRIQGAATLPREVVLDGVQPERVPAGRSLRVVAVLPGGAVEPLVWLHEYDARFAHPFLFKEPLRLPAGTAIRGLPPDVVLLLIPAQG